MSTFNAGAIEASLTLDRSSWNRELKAAQAQIRRMEARTINIGVELDSDQFDRSVEEVNLRADELALRSLDIAATMDSSQFMDEAVRVEAEIEAIQANDLTIGVDTRGMPETMAELAALEAEVMAVDGNDITIHVDYDRNEFERLVGGGSNPLSSGGGGYLGFWRILILAIIALSPILSVAIGTMGAAIVGFTAALVAALGPLAIIIGMMAILIKRFKDTDFKDMTPGMRALAEQWARLQGIIDEVANSPAAEHFYRAMALGISALTGIIEAFLPYLSDIGKYVEDVAGQINKFISSKEFDSWVDFFGGFGLDMLKVFVDIGGDLIRFLMNLFIAIRPFARRMMGGLQDALDNLADWSENIGKSKGFQEWIDNALYYGPMLLDLVGDIWRIFRKLGDAIRPFAEPMIKGFDAIADAIERIPTNVLTQMILVGAGLYATFHIVLPLISSVVGGISLLADGFGLLAGALGISLGPLLLIIGAIVVLGALLVYMYQTNEKFRDSVLDSWDAIKKAVEPIITDISNLIRDNWGGIQEWAGSVWYNIRDIIVSVMTIIQVQILTVTTVITFIWQHFGDNIIRIIKGVFQVIGGIIRGSLIVISGIMRLIADVLTGRWDRIGSDLRRIVHGIVVAVTGIFRGQLNIFGGIMGILWRIISAGWRGIWNAAQALARQGVRNIQGIFHAFVGWLSGIPGQVGHALHGMWSGLSSGFAAAINAIVDYWNGLSFGIPGFNPPGPGSFPGIQVSTPNLPHFAGGAFVDEPTVALVGEGKEPEFVSPESMMADVVSKYSGRIDYKKLANAITTALSPLLGSALTHAMLERILEKAGANIRVDASDDDRSTQALAAEMAWQLRLLGFGGN